MRAALAQRDFRLLWVGQTVSAVGDQIFPVAVALRIIEAGGQASDLGFVLAGRGLAMALFLLGGGVVADRMRRTRVMVGADIVRMVAVLGLAFAPADVPLLALAALTFLVGAGEAFFRPAFGAIVPTVLPPQHLQSGNALTSISLRTGAILGPAIGGALVATVGTSTAFVVDAATFAVSLVALQLVREAAAIRGVRQSAARDLAEGVRAVTQRPWIAAILVMAVAHVTLAVAPWTVLLPLVATDDLGGAGAYSLSLSLFGAGAVLGALLTTRYTPRQPGVIGLVGLLPFAAVLASLAVAAPLWVVAACHLAMGWGLESFHVLWATALQRDIPGPLLARVTALDYFGSLALMPFGLALVGPAAEAFGRSGVLWFAAAVVAVTSLLPVAVRGGRTLSTPPAPVSAPT